MKLSLATLPLGVWKVIAGLLVALLLILLLRGCGRTVPPLSPETQKTLDSLAITRPAHEAAVDSGIRTARRTSARADELVARARRITPKPRTISQLSTGHDLIVVADSVEHWKAIAVRERFRADSFEVANGMLLTADSLRKDSTERALFRVVVDVKDRIRAEEGAMGKVIADAKQANRCRWGPFPCPTRTQAAIGGVVLGAVAVSVALQR